MENASKLVQGDVPPQILSHNKIPFPHKRRKRENKIWFDHELQTLKDMTKKLSNQKHQFPENLHLRKLHKDSLKKL